MSFWFKHRTIAIPECDRIMNRSNLFVSHHAGVRQQEQTDTVSSSAGDLHLRRVPRLINKPLTRSRLCQATLPAAGNAKIARCILGEIYGSIADGEEQDAYEKRYHYIRCRELVNYWTANPVVGIPIGPDCTIRRPSGAEFLVREAMLRELGTMRRFYQHVQDLFELPKHISLHLRFIRGRREDEVPCDDRSCRRCLRGTILLAVVLP